MTTAEIVARTIDFVLKALPVFLPIMLGYAVAEKWVRFAKKRYIANQNYILLEIIPPKDVFKSPLAMELVLTAVHNTGSETTWIDRYWHGKSRADFSLEMVSIEGNVHFFIRCRSGNRKYLETQLYSQYPGVEIHEAEDYTAGVEYDPNVNEVYAHHFCLNKPDAYPIKTYIDWGLDQSVEEEEKIDPLVPTLEYMGSLGLGEQLWYQIIIRGHKASKMDWPGDSLLKKILHPSTWDDRTDTWQAEAKSEIQKIRSESITLTPEGDSVKAVQNQTKGQQLRIAALERSITKLAFDVGIRVIYIAHKDVFDGARIGAVRNSFKQFGSADLNSFGPRVGDADYFWEDPFGLKAKEQKAEYVRDYRERNYFYDTFKQYFWWRPGRQVKRPMQILNSEELATIFHFPGKVAGTPTLGRIESRKGAPPPNLPI